MKKLRLRVWVKVVLVILVLAGLMMVLNKVNENGMSECTKNHSVTFCERELQ